MNKDHYHRYDSCNSEHEGSYLFLFLHSFLLVEEGFLPASWLLPPLSRQVPELQSARPPAVTMEMVTTGGSARLRKQAHD